MNILRKVGINEILKDINTDEAAKKRVLLADRHFNSYWQMVELELDEVLNIMLPWHKGENYRSSEEEDLIPQRGMTVENAIKRFRNLSDYSKTNSTCFNKIQSSKQMEFKFIHLSIAPMLSENDYKNILDYKAKLVHLDGLHRLIGWGLAGKYDQEKYANDKLQAFVAGKL